LTIVVAGFMASKSILDARATRIKRHFKDFEIEQWPRNQPCSRRGARLLPEIATLGRHVHKVCASTKTSHVPPSLVVASRDGL
jgi:hypothetical protein